MDKTTLLQIIYAKYNELESLKKFFKDDELSLLIIQGKLDTLNDIERLIGSEVSL